LNAVDPFQGIEELQSVLSQRAQESGRLPPDEGKKKAKSGKLVAGSNQLSDLTVVQPIQKVEVDDLNFFLFVVPYVIPCEILTLMIRTEQQSLRHPE
jgi:hypothetical protein